MDGGSGMATNRSNVVKTAQFQAVDREQRLDEETILRLLASGRTATADWLPGRASIVDIAETLAGMANARAESWCWASRRARPAGRRRRRGNGGQSRAGSGAVDHPAVDYPAAAGVLAGAPMVAVVVLRGCRTSTRWTAAT